VRVLLDTAPRTSKRAIVFKRVNKTQNGGIASLEKVRAESGLLVGVCGICRQAALAGKNAPKSTRPLTCTSPSRPQVLLRAVHGLIAMSALAAGHGCKGRITHGRVGDGGILMFDLALVVRRVGRGGVGWCWWAACRQQSPMRALRSSCFPVRSRPPPPCRPPRTRRPT
jgi:hypothetical protein